MSLTNSQIMSLFHDSDLKRDFFVEKNFEKNFEIN